MFHWSTLLLLLCGVLSCKGSGSSQPGKLSAHCATSADCQSPLVCTAAACSVPSRHYTFRSISGVSMGAAGSSRLAAAHPERFDAVGMLGGPLDATLLLRMLEGNYLAGFCTPGQLAAALAADNGDNGNRLDREAGIAGCTPQTTPAGHYNHPNRFNKWHYTTNGGHFDRDASIDIFTDLMLALGNPLSQDPAQPQATPPLTPGQLASATCDAPAVVEHYIDARYSPHGEHRAITFCDGEPPLVLCGDGALVDWCAAAALEGRKLARASDADAWCAAGHGGNAHEADQNTEADAYFGHHGEQRGCWPAKKPLPFALALDMNRNGRRDYHEPIVFAVHEPFQDVGKDGCPDPLEDGKGGCTTADKSPFASGVKDPNGDNYDAVSNPTGTEGNFRYDPGEPFEDVGLDGVAGTHDFGEGDGKFTQAPGLDAWLSGDLRLSLQRFSPAQLASLDLYMDGGIRDIFDLGAQAEALAGGVQAAMPDGLHAFLDFDSIPSPNGGWPDGFDPLVFDPHALGRNTFLPYGSPAATPAQIRSGDGDHVGTVAEVYRRFTTFFRWVSARYDPIEKPQPIHGNSGGDTIRYRSAALGADRDFVVTLPRGYADAANAGKRYPVLMMLHGYGQTPGDMSGTSVFLDLLVSEGRMRPTIVIYPDGRCCHRNAAGDRICTEDQAQSASGYERECRRGSFFVNHPGPQGTRYGDAVLELLDEVDKRYRTLAPADGPAF